MKHEKEFSINVIFYKVISVLFLILLAVVSYTRPLLDKMDLWMHDLRHQAYTVGFLAIILGCFGIWAIWGKK